MAELLDAALEYASAGWYVFPIKPYAKKPPLIKDQYNNSSNDPSQIKEWWTDTPMANIGLDCGKSGVDVVDVDAKHEGILKTLEGMKLVSGGRRAWDTRIHETPGGGFHYIFQAGGLPTLSGTFGGEGIDTRGKGGYIILPPSGLAQYGYKKYRPLNSNKFLPVPKQLIVPPENKEQINPSGKTDLEQLLTSQEPIRDGARNTVLHRIASKLIRMGFAEVETRAAIFSVNKLRCIPPYPENDIIYLVKKAYEYYKPVENLVGDAQREQIEGDWNDQDQAVAVSLGTFMAEQEDGITWLLEGILPTSSLNMIQGNPKCGKSTLARHLAVAAATGGDVLEISFTNPVPVLYYSLQESKKQWKTWLPGIIDEESLDLLQMQVIWRLGKKGPPAITGLRERILAKGYKLVIIDMISTFLQLKDLDKYAEVEKSLSMMNDIAQETGCCIVWLHHERKSGGGFEAGIGSQAFRGAVYTTIRCERENREFTFSTEQREGEDREDTVIKFSEDRRKLVTSEKKPKLQAEIDKAEEKRRRR